MNIVSKYGDKCDIINKVRFKVQVHDVLQESLHIRKIYHIKYLDYIFLEAHRVIRIQIVHSFYALANKMHMDMDTITRLMNLGIVEEDDDGVVTLTGKYMKYLDDVCNRLLSNGYGDVCLDDPYSFMLDSNAYAITSWVGVIKESELVEMLNTVMGIWSEMLLW